MSRPPRLSLFVISLPSTTNLTYSNHQTTVAQSMGSAFILPAAQAIFQSQLIKALRTYAPGINPLMVLSAGATNKDISNFPITVVSEIARSYVVALRYTFALGILVAGLAFVVGFFMPWFRYQDGEKKGGDVGGRLGNGDLGTEKEVSETGKKENGE